ncbi:MAG: hypothetical protein AVO35_00420 [Candidatus Aegiribacteria sp. MLS_C]|nr:MAG: hypothetical protein AVO35_00420 [Candidatus Aegiribacteria sp. MLS_C]
MVRYLGILPAILLLLTGCDSTSYPFSSVTGPCEYYFELPSSGLVNITVVNSYMVIVRTLVSGQTYAQGSHTGTWDLMDDSGERVPDGLYCVRVFLDGELHDTDMFEVHE